MGLGFSYGHYIGHRRKVRYSIGIRRNRRDDEHSKNSRHPGNEGGCYRVEYMTPPFPIDVREAMESDAPVLASLRDAFWSDQISKGSIDHPEIESVRLQADAAV